MSNNKVVNSLDDFSKKHSSWFSQASSLAAVGLCSSMLALSTIGIAVADDDHEVLPRSESRRDKVATAKQMLVTQQTAYSPNINVAAYYLGNNDAKEAGDFQLFIPIWQQANKLLFTNLRLYDKSSTPLEVNFAVGYRFIHGDNQLFGFYGGFDRLKSSDGNYFSQLTAGFEYWHDKFFVGGNAYLPVGDTKIGDDLINTASYSTDSDNASYQNIVFKDGYEEALKGADAEVGYNVWGNLMLYTGVYYFGGGTDDSTTLVGPKLRATYTWYAEDNSPLLGLFDRIQLETQVNHDSFRGTQTYAGIRFTINLIPDVKLAKGIARRMTDHIHRDMDVVAQKEQGSSAVLTGDDGNPLRFLTVTGQNDSSVDVDTLNSALQDNNADVIIVNGTLDLTGSSLSLSDLNKDTYLNGGNYHFTQDGQNFTIDSGGHGAITATDDQTLIYLDDATYNLTLDNVKLSLPDDAVSSVISNVTETGDHSFGTLTLKNGTVISGGSGINIDLDAVDDAAQTGTLAITDTTITTDSGLTALSVLVQNEAALTFSEFSGNTISSLSDESGVAVRAIYLEAYTDSDIIFSNGIYNNSFSAVSTAGGNTYAILSAGTGQITVNGDFSNNSLLAQSATTSNSISVYDIYNTGNWQINGNFENNQLTADTYADLQSYSSARVQVKNFGIYNYGSSEDFVVTGSFSHNTFTMTNTIINNEVDANIRAVNRGIQVGRYADFSTGDFSDNTFVLSSNVNSSVENISSQIYNSAVRAGNLGTFSSDSFTNNNIEITSTASIEGGSSTIKNEAIYNRDEMSLGDISNNNFNLTINNAATTSEYSYNVAIEDAGNNFYAGSINNNTVYLSATDSMSTADVYNYGFYIDNSSRLGITGDIEGNTFDVSSSSTSGDSIGIYIRSVRDISFSSSQIEEDNTFINVTTPVSIIEDS